MQTTATELERSTMEHVTWRLLPFLLLLYIVSWLDRVNVGFAKLQMNADLGMSDTAFGLGAGLFFFVGYALFEVPSNLLLVRFGARIWIARIMITWGLLSAGMMFVEGTTSFYVMRFLLGVAEAGFLPGIVYYLSQWFPREQRARAVSWFMIGIPLSVVFGGPLSGYLLGFDGYMGLRGWQWLFIIEGLPAVFLGFVVLGFLTDKPADARWLTAEQRQWLGERLHAEHVEAGHHQFSVRQVLLHPTVWFLAAIMFCCQFGSYGLTFWVPSVVKGLAGYSNLEVGFFSALPYIAAAIGMVLLGRSSDRSGERFLHVAIPTAIGAVGFIAVGLLLSAPIAAMFALAVAAVGDYSTRGPFWALPGKFLSGSALAGAIALINAMGAVGGAIGPSSVGYLKDLTGTFMVPMMLLSGVLMTGSILTLWLRRSRKIPN
jgi:ACS family tartrate transporter-like MFS transporter